MVRHTEADDDESPAENPPAFADLIGTVDDLAEGEHIRVVYAHKSRHTLDEPDKTTTIDGYVTVADATFEESYGKNRDRFRLEFRTNHPDSEYAGALFRIKTGGVNKTASNPCYVSKSTGPSVRHFDQLGRVDSIEVVDDEDDEPQTATEAADEHTDDDTDPVDMAFAEPSNDDDTVCVRFTGDRDDGVSFRVTDASLYKDWYNPDRIIVEHFDVADAVDDALEVLREDADLRGVREARVGAFRFDRDTGDLAEVSIYGVDVDDEDATKRRMRACFDDPDAVTDGGYVGATQAEVDAAIPEVGE